MTKRGYALVPMDCQMPRMDGFAATPAIRALEAPLHRHTASIALTAGVVVEERARCLEAGMDDFLSKPILPAALSTALASWVSRTARICATEPAAGVGASSAHQRGRIWPDRGCRVFARKTLIVLNKRRLSPLRNRHTSHTAAAPIDLEASGTRPVAGHSRVTSDSKVVSRPFRREGHGVPLPARAVTEPSASASNEPSDPTSNIAGNLS
jgi:DNA-binding response OmpR family regulator